MNGWHRRASSKSCSRLSLCVTLAAVGLACATTAPPPLEDPGSLPPVRFEREDGRLTVSAALAGAPALVPVESRSFADTGELVEFARRELGAEPVYGDDGELIAIGGELVETGEILFRDRDGTVFADRELVAAYLGGAAGRLTVGGRVLDLQALDDDSSIALASESETCQGNDCVSGETWVTHRIFYHSVGGTTRQTSGGMRSVSYRCCRAGTLVTVGGQRRCRRLAPGAWEYDRELGRLVPKADFEGDPYVYAETDTCFSEILSNQLRLNVRVIFGPTLQTDFFFQGDNVPEVRFKRWRLAVNLLDTDWVDEVIGVCGFHSSTRGGSLRTSDGFTGDDGVLCGSFP